MNDENLKLYGSVLGSRGKLWKAEIEMMDYFIDVCSKHDIKVFLIYGTLLGAVRHKGFIPWDEDIDLCVTREDFEKICSIAYEFKKPYSWQYALNDRNYFFGYGRLRRSDMLGYIPNMSHYNYNQGLFIDIFILDEISSNNAVRKKVWRKSNYYSKLMANYYHPYKTKNTLTNVMSPIFHFLSRFYTYEKLYGKYINTIKKPKKENSGLYSIIFYKDYDKQIFRYEDFFPGSMLTFEGKCYLCPTNYKKVLTTFYGDYMKEPPESEKYTFHNGACIFSAEVSPTVFLDKYAKNIIEHK